jgi:hypothetical protein
LATHWHTHAHPHPPTPLISPTQLVACGAASNMARRGHQATLPRGSRLDSSRMLHPSLHDRHTHPPTRILRMGTRRVAWRAHHHEPHCSPPRTTLLTTTNHPAHHPQRDPQCWNSSLSASIHGSSFVSFHRCAHALLYTSCATLLLSRAHASCAMSSAATQTNTRHSDTPTLISAAHWCSATFGCEEDCADAITQVSSHPALRAARRATQDTLAWRSATRRALSSEATTTMRPSGASRMMLLRQPLSALWTTSVRLFNLEVCVCVCVCVCVRPRPCSCADAVVCHHTPTCCTDAAGPL